MKWNYLIVFSFILVLIGFWKKNDFSTNMQPLAELSAEPIQKKIKDREFTVSVNKVDYKIKPLYDYDLYGIIVSYKLHDGDSRLHKLWNDHLNVADYCVIWGDTAAANTLPKLKFWNGQFTCNFSTRDQQAWSNFNPSQLSNNHLIAADKLVRKQIGRIKIGDQIRVRGQLVEYQNLNTSGTRGTSITRDDTGNGACETIFVSEVVILKTYTSIWRIVMYTSLVIFLLSLTLYLKAPHRTRGM